MTRSLSNVPGGGVSLESNPYLWDRIARMPQHKREALLAKMAPRIVDPYVPHVPHPPQMVFLGLNYEREVFYGGAAGGGKSDSLLMSALQYVDVPGYAALILRKTFKDLTLPGAIMDRANDWLQHTPARRRNGGQLWEFPTGAGLPPATLSFGHLMFHSATEQYRSAEFQFIGIDELTQFEERTYEFMFSRIRRPALPCQWCPRQVEQDPDAPKGVWRHKEMVTGAVRVRTCGTPQPRASSVEQYQPSAYDGVTTLFDVPLRMRSASNPGGIGHCVPYGDVLTPQGWRDIRSLRIGDPVYQVTPTGALEPTVVRQVHRHVAPEIVVAEARGLHMALTPEHRVAKIGGTERDRSTPFSLVPWSDLPGQANILRAPLSWAGVPIGTYKVPRRIGRNPQPEVLTGLQYAAFMGWFLTEGNLIPRDKALGISQTKPVTRARLQLLLDGCGFTYSATPSGFTLYAADWYERLADTGLCRDKRVPREILDASPEEMAAFLDAAVDGDGHRVSETSGQFYSTSPYLADGVAEIATKLGYLVRVSKRTRPDREGFEHRVDIKRSKTGATELLTGHHKYNVATTTKRRSQITTLTTPTPVYCIGVDSHAFVIRQQGSVWVSGNSWVRDRFVDPRLKRPGCRFVPAKLTDNPSLDQESYRESLSHMSRTTRLQLEEGQWDVVDENAMLKRHWFTGVEDWPKDGAAYCRYWDLAATAAAPGKTPDWTVGALLALRDGVWYLIDLRRTQSRPADVERLVLATAHQDIERVGGGYGKVKVAMEQEPGSSGVNTIATYRRLLAGFPFEGDRPSGPKEERARPLAVAAENDNFKILTASWNRAFLDEAEAFPYGPHDDQIDAVTGAMKMLVPLRKARLIV